MEGRLGLRENMRCKMVRKFFVDFLMLRVRSQKRAKIVGCIIGSPSSRSIMLSVSGIPKTVLGVYKCYFN